MREPDAAYRSREHLTEREVERLIEAAKDNRWGHRDATMVLLAFRHGLRASELVDLRWEQVDLENAILHVRRVKQGTPATHPLTGRELRALRRLQREQARRGDDCLHLWPRALEPANVNDAAPHHESTDRCVVLVLHHNLHTSLRLEQRPGIFWRRRNARANQGNYAFKFNERKHSRQPGQAHTERP